MRKSIIYISIILITSFLYSCDKETGTLSDVTQTAALKNVSFEYDSIQFSFDFPEGAFDGKTLAELIKLDSSTFANPANYGVSLSLNIEADNTKSNAKEAKFDGMAIDIVMDTITSTPIKTQVDAFTISPKEVKQVAAEGFINLETHRLTGLYIFRQVVDGQDLSTTLATYLNYDYGLLKGDIPLPALHKDIPTRASEKTKAFLSDLLDSGIFDVTE